MVMVTWARGKAMWGAWSTANVLGCEGKWGCGVVGLETVLCSVVEAGLGGYERRGWVVPGVGGGGRKGIIFYVSFLMIRKWNAQWWTGAHRSHSRGTV